MRSRNAMLAPIAVACFAQLAFAETKEFLLIPMSANLGGKSRAVVTEPPKPVQFKAVDCATSGNVGETSEFALALAKKNYTGTAYSGEMRVEGSSTLSGFVMGRQIKVGTQLSNFTLLDDGQTCSELINGKPMVFKKYTAVWQ